jgi:hypothetical protein
MVTVNPPTTTAGPAAAISPLMTGFPPGHFFDLTGEQLLSRAGFEEMQGGYRVAMATTPHVGPTTKETVAYRTYVRDRRDDLDTMTEVDWGFEKFGAAYVASSLVGRNAEVVVNPYATRVQPPVAVLPVGTSVLTDAATGATLLEQFGALSATEAAVIGDAIAAAGAADVARVTVRG